MKAGSFRIWLEAGSFRMRWRLGHSGCGWSLGHSGCGRDWVIQDVVKAGSFRMW